MLKPQYALVAYVKHPVGEFVESLRRELHERLNAGIFACREQWPYMPHLTIVKMATEEKALQAFEIARELWNQFQGSRRIAVEELTFVRQGEQNTWVDLAPIPLGRSLVSGKSW